MTLVVCKQSGQELIAVADTRISSNLNTLTDTGAKLFVVAVTTRFFNENVLESSFHYSLGFAFCGSTLLAANTHAIASNCTQIIRNDESNNIPSVEEIAQIYARVSDYVTRDVNKRKVDPKEFQRFQGLVFGYCPVERKLRLFSIEPQIERSEFRVDVLEHKMEEGTLIVIGNGREEFAKQISIKNSSGNMRSVLDVMMQIFDEELVEGVGGHVQILSTSEAGANISPTLIQDPDNLDQAILSVNGFNTGKVVLSGGLKIGLQATGVGVEKIVGRQALREMGIDPDLKDIPIDLQNLASIEMGVKTAFNEKRQLNVDTNLRIRNINPIKWGWYFHTRCNFCSRYTPVISDPSSRKMKKPFVGTGAFISNCYYCKSVVASLVVNLKSLQWEG